MFNNDRSPVEIIRFIKVGMNFSNRRGAIIDSWHLKMQAYSNWKVFYFEECESFKRWWNLDQRWWEKLYRIG